jgi:tetratricopeptide (TPR) repeat protein
MEEQVTVADVLKLLRKAKVAEAVSAAGKVKDKKLMAEKMTEFASQLNHLKGYNLITEIYLKKSLELDPSNAETYYALGLLYTNPGVLDKYPHVEKSAIESYEKALEHNPKLHEARYNLALLYYFTGDKDRARREYDQLTEYLGDDRRFRELGMMFLEEKRMKEYSQPKS